MTTHDKNPDVARGDGAHEDEASARPEAARSAAAGMTAPDDEADMYPLALRIFGFISIIGGLLHVNSFIMTLLAVFFGKVDVATLSGHALTTVVIGIVTMVLSGVLAVMFVILGVRLLRGKRHLVARLSVIMIAIEALVLVCHFMLSGLSSALNGPVVNMIILVVLESYSDPALRAERRLQRRLQELEWREEAEEGTLGRDLTGKGYITLNFFNLFWVFVICCVLGLIVEEVYHVLIEDPGHLQDRAGLLYGPFSPIYGFGAVLMTVALNRFHDRSPVLVFVVSAVIGGAFEYFVSWFMEVSFGLVAWDYSGTFLNINGRTNFMFMCFWGLLGLLWVRFALPVMLKIVNKIPWNWRYIVTSVCTALMLADCVLTLAAFDCWFQRESNTMDYDHASAIVAFCNERYDNDFMQNRFQSMGMDTGKAARAA